MTGVDGAGIYGALYVYSMMIALILSNVLAFLYFWWNGKLCMNEEPKYQMLHEEQGADKGGSDE